MVSSCVLGSRWYGALAYVALAYIALAHMALVAGPAFAQGQIELLPPSESQVVQGGYPLPATGLDPALVTGPLQLPSLGYGVPPEGALETGLPIVTEEVGGPPSLMPTWFNPFAVVGPSWDGSFEVGINGSDGNANAFSLRTGFELSREGPRADWNVDFTYAKAQSRDIETQHNALLRAQWDWKLPDPRWSLFTKTVLEYDEFKAFNLRVVLNSGLAYKFIDNDQTALKGRFGAGASREYGGGDEFWKPEALFGFDFRHQLTSRQKFQYTLDYFPNWEDFSDYRLVTDMGWEVVLDETTNLSLKLNVIDRYDSTPNGAKPNDIDYSILLIWKK